MFRSLTPFHRNRSDVPAERSSGDSFLRLQHEMNRLFDDAFAGFGLPSAFGAGPFSGDASARIDVRETDDAIEVEAELPGVADDDIDVQLVDNVLTIRGEKRSEHEEKKKGGYFVKERAYGSFARSVPLPYDVDPDTIEAVFTNGLLTLTLPKPPEAARETKKIAIKRGRSAD
ncbi:MAG: Hsp20/alpha crystallin family protein [Parvularculaceae bacterium]